MKIAIIGYGKMGHEIESIAISRGHEIALIIDKNDRDKLNNENLDKVDVAIEFTTPETAFENVKTCLLAGKPIVCGTTGWIDKLGEAKAMAENGNGAFFYASNYSIGVNLFFRINRILAKYIDKVKGYSVSIEETHHTQKKDAPSGTAITLANIISEEMSSYQGWTLLPEVEKRKIPIGAIREEDITGNHSVVYDSELDEITLVHKAKSRKGFALGAVLAAEYCIGKKGFLTMDSFFQMD
jgi:4-hydroxy-tetrahydrodipicolinate reductase